jgi:hypothetical protein
MPSPHQQIMGSATPTANSQASFAYYPQQPNVTFAPPPRYTAASATSTFDMATMQFHPPQHLTAEAVAALPPPGT